MENYYRLDPQEAVDSVCDQSGDKGIDGIFVNDNTQSITVFQSYISQKNNLLGDVKLKQFSGSLNQFKSVESVQKLLDSAGEAHVASLIKRLNVVEKIDEYELKGEFLTNIDVDTNGSSYLDHATEVNFVGRTALIETYISDERDAPIHAPVSFDISRFQITEYAVDKNTKTFISPICAKELLKLDGVANQALFIHNVRGPLGRTNVNRAIKASLKDPQLHKKFPLFHNGITVIAGTIDVDNDLLTISDYYVVNGCQSLTSLYENKKHLTDSLYVLAKFIKVEPNSDLARQITEFSNNQNGVKLRDFKANSSPQIRLQNEFLTNYQDTYVYEIKRGEKLLNGTQISNEDAGLYLMTFDLKEPWATHRKYQVFDDRHSAIFNRPEVTADRIVMCQVIREESDVASGKIKNTLFGKYALTRYLLMYVVREILEEDELGAETIRQPEHFVRSEIDRAVFKSCINTLLKDVVIDLNDEVKQFGDDFDYRGRLRDEKWVKSLTRTIVTGYQKQVSRNRIPSFKKDWETESVTCFV